MVRSRVARRVRLIVERLDAVDYVSVDSYPYAR